MNENINNNGTYNTQTPNFVQNPQFTSQGVPQFAPYVPQGPQGQQGPSFSFNDPNNPNYAPQNKGFKPQDISINPISWIVNLAVIVIAFYALPPIFWFAAEGVLWGRILWIAIAAAANKSRQRGDGQIF